MTRLILASGSPRRKELLEQIGLAFTVKVSHADETIPFGMSPEQAVMHLASVKAAAVAADEQDDFVIGADTIVLLDGEILGKPKSRQEAKEMLQRLSGRTHAVCTGVSIRYGADECVFYEKTYVTFWELAEEEINSYLDTGEPFDKAGAYGIQGAGAIFVKKIDGDYFAVVGLPLASLYRQLKRLGWQGNAFLFPS
ncbi:Maf family protein [Bacillus badius]|uniref:dTTP/UTP pyrophosphatase n=1 Tax=Bacillus badius TaxID=1455 RepID=A0ABR5AT73_BACBA|nr:Maf family protein [Bacillus badius]KIL75485.1 Septum formation protein Maf [Bacillus badius]KIL77953.1 Septum formation protein Maf [Bacillus badius]MED4716388.1 Maf family protein [Bacillus badius]